MSDLVAMRWQLPERVTLLISLIVGVGCHGAGGDIFSPETFLMYLLSGDWPKCRVVRAMMAEYQSLTLHCIQVET